MSIVDDILLSTREDESPQSFYYWATLVTISAILKDNVWINRASRYNLYPNIYVMLHADSGLKKGNPIALAKDLIKKVNNTNIISGRSSIQGILKQLGTSQTVPGGKIEQKSRAVIISSELSSSIVEDKAAATILTDLFDRHFNEGEWKSLLKMEEFTLKDPTITMFTGTNAAHNEEFLSKRDIQGGFYARTFIINESKRNTINSLVIPPKYPLVKEPIIAYLKELAKLKGEFAPLGSREKNDTCQIEGTQGNETVYFSPVGHIYHQWYNEFSRDTEEVQDETGTINRFGDAVLKVAMLISLSRDAKLEISSSAMHEAISQCQRLIGDARKTTMGKKGKGVYALHKTLIIEELIRRDNHAISRTQLNKKFWMHAEDSVWDEIMRSLETAKIINIENAGNIVLYKMSSEQVKNMTDFLSGRRHE